MCTLDAMVDASHTIEPAELLGAVLHPSVPQLRLLAVMTVSGAASLDGTSRSLGNSIDSELLNLLRVWSDAVLVGGGTARAENYFGVKCTNEDKAQRLARGQAEVPPLAIITESFDFDVDTQLFYDTEVPPLFLAPQHCVDDPALAGRREALQQAGGRILSTGDGSAHSIIDALRGQGFNRISCEGGPGLYGMLLAAGLGDILHLTIDPTLQGNVEKPLFGGGGDYTTSLEVEDVRVSEDSMMFVRYRLRGKAASREE